MAEKENVIPKTLNNSAKAAPGKPKRATTLPMGGFYQPWHNGFEANPRQNIVLSGVSASNRQLMANFNTSSLQPTVARVASAHGQAVNALPNPQG